MMIPADNLKCRSQDKLPVEFDSGRSRCLPWGTRDDESCMSPHSDMAASRAERERMHVAASSRNKR